MKARRRCAAALAAVLCAGLLGGCGRTGYGAAGAAAPDAPVSDTAVTETGPVELRVSFYGSQPRFDAWLAALDGFNASQQQVTAVGYYGAGEVWQNWTAAALPAGRAGDVLLLDGSWLTLYGGAGVFADLRQYDCIDTAQFSAEALADCTADGALLALPLNRTARVWLWDESLLARAGVSAPADAAELADAGRAFHAALGDDFYLFWPDAADRMDLLAEYLQAVHGRPWVHGGTVAYTAAEVADGLRFLLELESAHAIPTFAVMEAADAAVPAGEGGRYDPAAAGCTAGVWVWDQDLYAVPERFAAAGTVRLGDLAPGGTVKTGLAAAIPKSCAHPEQAAQVLEWLVNGPGAQALGTVCGVPVSQAAQAQVTPDARTAAAHEAALAQVGQPRDPRCEAAGLTGAGGSYERIFSALSWGDCTVEEAAAWLIQDVNAALRAE